MKPINNSIASITAGVNVMNLTEYMYVSFLNSVPDFCGDYTHKRHTLSKELLFEQSVHETVLDQTGYFLNLARNWDGRTSVEPEFNREDWRTFSFTILNIVTVHFSVLIDESNRNILASHFGCEGYIVAVLAAVYGYMKMLDHVDWSRLESIFIILGSDDDERLFQGRKNFSISGMNQHLPADNLQAAKVRIYCSRKQEIIKLLFHELNHFSKFDHERLITSVATECSWNITFFTLGQHLIEKEAYAETYAILQNTAFSLAMIKLFSRDRQELSLTLEQIINAEIEYSILLSGNLLQWMYEEDHEHDDLGKSEPFSERVGNSPKDIYDLFFSGKGSLEHPFYANIYIWEYVFMRTSLLLTDLTQLFYDYSSLIQFHSISENKVIKYVVFELDWQRLLAPVLK